MEARHLGAQIACRDVGSDMGNVLKILPPGLAGRSMSDCRGNIARRKGCAVDAEGTVTYWLDRLKAGDETAEQKLWQAYGERLANLALKHLRSDQRRAVNEEDVALSAFNTFFVGVRRGRFLRLEDRNDLWQVLVMLTRSKAANQRKHDLRQKRGGGRVRGESAFEGDSGDLGIGQIIDAEPTPAEAAQFVEEFMGRLAMLPEDLREVALLKLEGYTVQEIAVRYQCVSRTIERRLQLIRSTWSEEGE